MTDVDARPTHPLKTLLWKGLSALMGLALLAVCGTAAGQSEQPNVIIILADDLGYGDLASYGHPKFKTPNLDRMVAEGARLTNFYTPCPYCAPTRASLQTGRYPFRSGVTRNPAPDAGINDVGMPDSEVTLGEAFHAAGYRTLCLGKWHMGHLPEYMPLRHGYDEYLGILYSNDMRPVALYEGNEVIENPVDQRTLTKRYTERAVRFITENAERPFFLYFPQAMPHKPLAASDAYYKQTGTGLYGDVIAELDWSVGQILETLKAKGIDEKTLVMFTSDNGPWYGGSTGGLRGMKGNMTDGGIRVPLIARWPGLIPAGHVSDAPAVMMDLYPTSLIAAGIPLPEVDVLDGKDLWGVLASDGPSPHEALFAGRGEELMTVRSGKWKYHAVGLSTPHLIADPASWVDPRAPDGTTILAPVEQPQPDEYPGVKTGDTWKDVALFDLESDPSEQHNVAADHPDVVRRLQTLMDEMRKQERQAEAARGKK